MEAYYITTGIRQKSSCNASIIKDRRLSKTKTMKQKIKYLRLALTQLTYTKKQRTEDTKKCGTIAGGKLSK